MGRTSFGGCREGNQEAGKLGPTGKRRLSSESSKQAKEAKAGQRRGTGQLQDVGAAYRPGAQDDFRIGLDMDRLGSKGGRPKASTAGKWSNQLMLFVESAMSLPNQTRRTPPSFFWCLDPILLADIDNLFSRHRHFLNAVTKCEARSNKIAQKSNKTKLHDSG